MSGLYITLREAFESARLPNLWLRRKRVASALLIGPSLTPLVPR